MRNILISLAIMWSACVARGQNIEGVQPAAMDQPRIYVNLRTSAGASPLHTSDKDKLSGVEAFLDTGASGIMLSADTVQKLGVAREKDTTFQDVGVAGGEEFGVSQPLFLATAKYPKSDPEDTNAYSKPIGPFRTQIKAGGGLVDLISPGMDIVGMPVMLGKVILLDPSPIEKYDKINTSILTPGDRSIPKTSRHVPLTMVSFEKFTRLKSATGAAGPNLAANPMIGPDPFKPDTSHKQVVITHNGKTARGTFLLDTGASTSMVSSKLAGQLGVQIQRDQKFQLAVGGVGGASESGGLFFDRMELPTIENKPIIFVKAPLLVVDITVKDQAGQSYTLDGVLGMNFLVPSVEITGGLLPDIGKIVSGPFRWIVIDLRQNTLGLEPKQ